MKIHAFSFALSAVREVAWHLLAVQLDRDVHVVLVVEIQEGHALGLARVAVRQQLDLRPGCFAEKT